MLFDLKGRRRRLIQATYLMLAVLMGGGLVLFGIGGDVQGGLFDAFSDPSQRGTDNPVVERRIESAEKRLRANPKDEAALRELARGYFQVASQDQNPNTNAYTAEGKENLRKSARAWERYLALEPKRPDPSLARQMTQVYSELGLNQPAKAAQAWEIVAEAEPTSASFLQLAHYAKLAGQDRKAKLAGQRAIDLAPKGQRKAVREQVAAIESGATAQGGEPTPGGTPQP